MQLLCMFKEDYTMFCLKLCLELLTILGAYATSSEAACGRHQQCTCAACIVPAAPHATQRHKHLTAALSLPYNLAVAQHLHIETHSIFIRNYFPFPPPLYYY